MSSASLIQPQQLELVPGAIVDGKYRIDGILGTGGMGVVLSATHLELDAPVAIKVVRDDLAQNEEVVSRLIFEARAAARMRGTHIVRVLDVARLSTGAPYIVMEQLQGSDLAVVLAQRASLPVAEAVHYVLQACEGLREAHALGIIHRDLKPENLFLAATPEGVVLKILDFGISKDVTASRRGGSPSTLTKAGLAVGSPYYMSPEQMRASSDLDARADIWSLGAILFELVTGKCPFEAETTALLATKIMLDEAPSLRAFSSAAPEALDAIVRRCLQKEPSARFQNVVELCQALHDFATAETHIGSGSRRVSSGIDLRTDPTVLAMQAAEATEENPFARKKTGIALFGVCAMLVVAGVAFWQLMSKHAEAELRPSNSGPAAVQPSRAVTAASAPVVSAAADAVPAENADVAAALSANPKPTAAPPKPVKGPLYWTPPGARHAEPSTETRYGL
jgi:eukaryotic-like serine/threonine-protein kinase